MVPDQDVMDTWATSAITPQLSALAVNSEFSLPDHRYNTIFPADLRSQSHEIIRTWAFYTILKAYYHANSLPWKNIMISGWCLADDKKKMSKSKGNIITPKSILDTYGADVVRYWTGVLVFSFLKLEIFTKFLLKKYQVKMKKVLYFEKTLEKVICLLNFIIFIASFYFTQI